MALPKPSTGLSPGDNIARIGAAFDAIDAATAAVAAASQAVTAAQQAIAQAQASADGKVSPSQLAQVQSALQATMDGRRYAYATQPASRPGDAPDRFTLVSAVGSLSGAGDSLPSLNGTNLALGDAGMAYRMRGAGIVASRAAFPIEPNRVYRARGAVQRRADPSDPSNDAVRIVLVWEDQAHNVLPGADAFAVLYNWPALFVASGRVEIATTFARAAGANVNIVAPANARYARVAAIVYGLDGLTDIEILGWADVTDATLLPAVSQDIAGRLATQESLNAGPRLSAIEGQLGNPNSLTFATKSAATSATISATVSTILLRGGTQAGDGRDGLYGRVSGLPAGSDNFTSQDGAKWLRVTIAGDLAIAILESAALSAPTAPDGLGANRLWKQGDSTGGAFLMITGTNT